MRTTYGSVLAQRHDTTAISMFIVQTSKGALSKMTSVIDER